MAVWGREGVSVWGREGVAVWKREGISAKEVAVCGREAIWWVDVSCDGCWAEVTF